MKLTSLSKRPFIAAASAAVLLAFASGAFAQPSSGLATPGFAKLPDAEIAQFKANPDNLLTTYASAGLPLSTEVRGLTLTDPSLVATLIEVAKKANDAQKGAIGAGLAEAARIMATTNPAGAADVQRLVAQSGLSPLITAFIALSNGTLTAAIGGGGGEGAGAGSGGATGGVGAAGGSNGGSNSGSSSFGSANSASGFGAIGGGGLTVSTTQAVSPFK